jgi:hypothetical protein
MPETKSVPDLEFMLPLLAMVPDGYFAVRPDTNEPWRFFRITRRDTKRYKNTTRIQSQGGDELYMRMIVFHDREHPIWTDPWWPQRDSLQTYLLLICADYKGALMKYAELTSHCGRCAKQLTDERSRWYGIGPECEKVMSWWIDEVDASEKGPYIEGVSDRDS